MSRLRIYGTQFVLGLLLAITLWTYVSFTTNPNETRQVTVPVRIVDLPEGMILVNPATGLPETFTGSTLLTIRGPQAQLGNLTGADLPAFVDVGDLGVGVSRIPIAVETPNGLRVTAKAPSEVTIRLAREMVATVPITVSLQGQPPFSFSVGNLVQGANEAIVRGPEEVVQRVAAATALISLQGQTMDVAAILPLVAVDANGTPVEGVIVTPDQVSVRVPIVAELGVRQVTVVPKLEGQPAPGFAVGNIFSDPQVVEVVTTGIVTGTFSTEPIDLTGLTTTITQTVAIQRPPNVITRPENIQVLVRVEIVPIAVTSQLPLPVFVNPINLAEGLPQPAAEPSTLQVILSGPFDRLSEVTSGAVSATVDLSGLGPGTYTLPVQIVAPDGLRVVEPVDAVVSVTIFPPPTPTPEPSPTFDPPVNSPTVFPVP
jgi:YbbR domain-containing protein